jgi:hypothetical protein
MTFQRETTPGLQACANEVARVLDRGKSRSWYIVTALSVLLVWIAIMSAFVVSFNSPTVGLGCRTLMYLLFGAFSSVSWLIQFWREPDWWAHLVSYVCNGLAILAMTVVVIFQVTIPGSRPDRVVRVAG